MSTKLTEAITINAPGKDVVFNGVDFTQNAFVTVNAANSITIRNCRVYGINVLSTERKHWFTIFGDNEVKLVVERNFFGDNDVAGGNVYNMLELNAKLTNGSSISDNYFTKATCKHNFVGLYGAAEGAIINMNRNHFEISPGGIRLGMKGAPICTINCNHNIIDEIDPRYGMEDQGILMFQPYAKLTPTFENCTVYLNGNKCPTEQEIYGFIRVGTDTQLTEDQYPKCYINGEYQDDLYVQFYGA